MSRASDTTDIIGDSGESTVVVRRPVTTFPAGTLQQSRTSTAVWTGDVYLDPGGRGRRGSYRKGPAGEEKEADAVAYFPQTSTVRVGDRIYPTGSVDFYEVLSVDQYEGHKEAACTKTEGRVDT